MESQQQVWNMIAESWTHFRNKPLKELENLDWKKGKIDYDPYKHWVDYWADKLN